MTRIARRALYLVVAGALGILATQTPVLAGVWSVGATPSKPVITSPAANAVFQTNCLVDCKCTRITDTDTFIEGCEETHPPDDLAAESAYPSWTASAGSFWGGDNKGAYVLWVPPTNGQRGITLNVTDDDLPLAVQNPPDSGTRNDDPVDADSVTGIAVVQYVLEQSDPLWWFNGATPANYHTEVNLTVTGITEGTFEWTITAGADKATFENDSTTITTVNDHTVGLKSTAASGSLNDVTVVVKLNDVDCKSGKNVTVYTPHAEMQTGIYDGRLTSGVHEGYDSYHYFYIDDQFANVLQATLELNENWLEPAQNEHTPATTWGQGVAETWDINPAGDIDHLWALMWGAGVIPISRYPGNGGAGVEHWWGEHYVGNHAAGVGVHVMTRRFHIFDDHGVREE